MMQPSIDVLLQQGQAAERDGRLDDAHARYLDVRARAVEGGDALLMATTSARLGVLAHMRGDQDAALHYYRLNVAELRTLGVPKEVLDALNRLGRLKTSLERWDEATRTFDEAVQIADAIGETHQRVRVELNRAELEVGRGDLAAARHACGAARALSSRADGAWAEAEIELHLGSIAREIGELPRAEEHLDRAERLASGRGDAVVLAEVERGRGALCRKQGRHRDALLHFNRAHRTLAQLAVSPSMPDLDSRIGRVERQFTDAVRHWAGSIESKDRYTQGHCERVADIASEIARRAGFDRHSLFWFRLGALVHDVGKVIVPSELLNKPGTLSDDEWALIKRHPVAGVEMLADMDFPPGVLRLVRSHHERIDGHGYPEGLAGDEVPRCARMLCIADVYDALTARRSYKGVLTHDAAMDIMRAEIGKQFDGEMFAHFEDLMRTRAPSLRQRVVLEPAVVERTAASVLAVAGPTDDLTGVLMRRPFVELANKILAERGPFATVALIVIDVDEFKPINDTHGHLQGDAVLRVVAGTLRELSAASGIVGRYAGDEFVILLPHTALNEAAELAERIRATVRRAAVPLRERAGSISVSLSLGVAAARSDHQDFDALFAAADRAMYEAKRRGRDTVVSSTASDAELQEPTLNLKTFVGRDAEMDRLNRLFSATLEEGVHLACIVGEAGVGKTALIRQLTAQIDNHGAALIAGRCSEAGAKPPFAPWAEVLSGIHQLGAVSGDGWCELVSLVPSIVPLRQPTGNKYALLDEIVAYLRLAAADRPLVVLLDDMQWSDTGTWDAVEHVMEQLSHERVLVCLTLRTEDTRGESLVRRNRLLRDERFHEIALERLDEAAASQWLASVFGGEATHELLVHVHTHAEGNPLLAAQLVRRLFDDGIVRRENGRWALRSDRDAELPRVLTGLMDRRLDRLSNKTRGILNTAAVIGRIFDIDLAIASGAGDEDDVLDALDEGHDHGVIESRPEASGAHFAFTHGLLVDAMCRAINPRRLVRIHEKVAEAMERLTPDNAAEIATHYDRAGSRHKPYRHAMVAAASAISAYTHADARRFFEIAERSAADGVERARALRGLAEVAETEGRLALAEELCDRALAALASQPEHTDHRDTLGLRRLRQRTRALQGQPANETLAACRDLLVLARDSNNRTEQAAVLNMISEYQARLGEWPDAEEVAYEAVAVAEETGDQRLLAESLTRLGASMLHQQPAGASEAYNRARALFRAAGDSSGEARCDISLGQIHERLGENAAAEAIYLQAHDAAARAHANELAGLASLHLGSLFLRRGQRDAASERYHEALDDFKESSNESHRLATLCAMAHLAREADDWGTASALYGQAVAVAGRIGQPDVELSARAGQALAALALGLRAIAEDAMRWIRANIETRPEWWFAGRDIVDALRVRLAAERGDDAHALRLLRDAVETAERHDPYAAAYLVVECAPSLQRSTGAVLQLIDHVSPSVNARGFAGIAERLDVLRVALAGATQAA